MRIRILRVHRMTLTISINIRKVTLSPHRPFRLSLYPPFTNFHLRLSKRSSHIVRVFRQQENGPLSEVDHERCQSRTMRMPHHLYQQRLMQINDSVEENGIGRRNFDKIFVERLKRSSRLL